MLLSHETFAQFSHLPMADPTTHTLALYCFGVSSREEVDAIAAAALAAGGTEADALAVYALSADRRLMLCATEHDAVRAAGLADHVVIADARDPVALADAVRLAGGPAAVTVVCVDVPGCEGGAVLSTAPGGTVIFFSMATSFSAAALGAEGVAADVTMLIGNGYVPGHAELALGLLRSEPGVRALFEARLAESG